MNSEYVDILKRCFLFQTISDDVIRLFIDKSKLIDYEHGQVIYDVGTVPESVFFVLNGAVKIEIPMPDGEVLFIGALPPGTLFGEHEALCNTSSVACVSSVGGSQLLVIPKTNFVKVFRAEAEFSQALAQQLAMSVRMMCLATAYHFNSSADKKLASLLVHLADRVGKGSDSGLKIDVKLSQDELADMMSSTRQTVNKYLQAWKKKGWIVIEQGVIEIINLAALKALTSEELLREFGAFNKHQ